MQGISELAVYISIDKPPAFIFKTRGHIIHLEGEEMLFQESFFDQPFVCLDSFRY